MEDFKEAHEKEAGLHRRERDSSGSNPFALLCGFSRLIPYSCPFEFTRVASLMER
jgi:hypothetical protein